MCRHIRCDNGGGSALIADEINEIKLDEVTVISASGFEQNIADAPASISVITQNQIKKRNHNDISTIVKDIAGLHAAPTPASINGRRDITLRGMKSKYTKFLIDGRPVSSEDAYSGLGSMGGIQSFLPPANAISRVEVIRGPMSSLYGTDAMGGVINVITKGFSNELQANINGSYTIAKESNVGNSYQTGFYLNGAIIPNLLGIQLYGKYAYKFEDKHDYGNPGLDDGNFGIKFIYNLTSNDEISIDYKHSSIKSKRTIGKTTFNFADHFEKDKSDIITLAHSGKYDKFLIDTYVMHDTTDVKSDQVKSNAKLKTMTFNTRGSYFFDNNTLTFGGEFRKQQLDEIRTNGLGDDVHTNRWDYSIFAEDEFNITDTLALTLGARYNYDKDYGRHISPRGYLVYRLNENLSFRGGVSTGYMTPNIKERTDGLAGPVAQGRGAIIGNKDLKPEKSINYEFGVNYTNDKFNAFATIFKTDFKDKIGNNFICTPWSGPCVYKGKTYRMIMDSVNIDKAQIKGIEIGGDFWLNEKLDIHTSYTYAKSEQKTGEYKGLTLNDIPQHLFKFGLNYDITPNLELWSQINYTGKISRPQYEQYGSVYPKAYTTADLGINYNISKNANVNLTIYNIFNKRAYQLLSGYKGTVVDGMKMQLGFNVNF